MALFRESYSSLPSDRQKSFIQRASVDFIPPIIPPANSPISLPSCTTLKSVRVLALASEQVRADGRDDGRDMGEIRNISPVL